MAVYSFLFSVIVACISYIIYKNYVNTYNSIVVKPGKRYDYIIVGAGASGCVIASRLSEDPSVKVLLIEAGDHMGYFTKIPLTATAAQQGPNDWSVKTTPQKYSSFGMWRQTQFLPRGKGLGGSSQINFLLHGLGVPSDFDRWTSLGFNWSYEKIRPYIVKAFGSVSSEFDSEDCAVDGECPGDKAPMKLKLLHGSELLTTFKQASDEIKDQKTFFKKPSATIKDGTRYTSYEAYLKPALGRENLHVLLKTQAISVRFENKTASSVYILQNHRELNNIFVNKEIILAAGTIKTPQILIRSGIGPQESLKKLKVRPVAINEAVGANLHDHFNMPIYVSIKKPISVTLSKVFTFNTVWEYFWNGAGFLSFPPVGGIECHDKSSVMLFAMGTASERLLRDLSNYRPQVFRDTFPFHNVTSKEGFMFLCSCLQPRSRGSVSLVDYSTTMAPAVNPNYLKDYDDVKCTIKAIRRAERLLSTKPFRDIGARVHWPRPERCLTFWNYTADEQKGRRKRMRKDQKSSKRHTNTLKSPPDEYLSCIIREVAVTGHHAGGTCAGGTVIDDQLRVKSVSGLRIMDASVLPAPITLFPNSIIIAMAERISDIIRNNKLNS